MEPGITRATLAASMYGVGVVILVALLVHREFVHSNVQRMAREVDQCRADVAEIRRDVNASRAVTGLRELLRQEQERWPRQQEQWPDDRR